MTKTTADELQKGITLVPDPQSPQFAGTVINVPLDRVAGYQANGGYLLCDGTEYSETTYSQLFNACGTQYNTGGETAGFFRVPNGPRQTKRVDLSSYFSSADNGGTLTEMYGFAEQKLDGKWYVTLWGQGTKTSNTTGTTLTFTSGTFNFEETTFPIGSYNVQNMLARTNAPDSIQTGTNPGNYGSWFISISDSPCTSAPSWADANLAFQPMIKAYDDYVNGVVMGINPATSSAAGTIIMNGSYGAGDGVWGLVQANKWQTKKLQVDQSSSGTITDLTFNNLVVGKKYRVYVQGAFSTSTDDDVSINIEHNGNVIGTTRARDNDTGSAQGQTQPAMAIVKATATTVTFVGVSVSAGGQILGNDTFLETWSMIEELNNYGDETTDFT